MRAISALFDRRRLRAALNSYPDYVPPFCGNPSELTRSQIETNFTSFVASIDERLTRLETFLDLFQVPLRVDDDGCSRVGAWIERYGALLVEGSHANISTLVSHAPPWIGRLAWAGVVNDLGTYAGMVVKSKRGLAEWGPLLDVGNSGDKDMIGYGQACLGNVANALYGDQVYMPYQIYEFCEARASQIKHGMSFSDWNKTGSLLTFVNILSGLEQPRYFKTY